MMKTMAIVSLVLNLILGAWLVLDHWPKTSTTGQKGSVPTTVNDAPWPQGRASVIDASRITATPMTVEAVEWDKTSRSFIDQIDERKAVKWIYD